MTGCLGLDGPLASAVLDLARSYAPAAEDIRVLVLPRDPLPRADAVVSVGHVLSYLPDEDAIDQALTAIARALRPGGLLANAVRHNEADGRVEVTTGRRTARPSCR